MIWAARNRIRGKMFAEIQAARRSQKSVISIFKYPRYFFDIFFDYSYEFIKRIYFNLSKAVIDR